MIARTVMHPMAFTVLQASIAKLRLTLPPGSQMTLRSP
jgi:hypothetical protein